MTAVSSHGQADKEESTTMLLLGGKITYSSTLKKQKSKYSRVTAYFIDTTI